MGKYEINSDVQVSLASDEQILNWIEYAELTLDLRSNEKKIRFCLWKIRQIIPTLQLHDLYTAVDLLSAGKIGMASEIRSLSPMNLTKLFMLYKNWQIRVSGNVQDDRFAVTAEKQEEFKKRFIELLIDEFNAFKEKKPQQHIIFWGHVLSSFQEWGLIPQEQDTELLQQSKIYQKNTNQRKEFSSIQNIIPTQNTYERLRVYAFFSELIEQDKCLQDVL